LYTMLVFRDKLSGSGMDSKLENTLKLIDEIKSIGEIYSKEDYNKIRIREDDLVESLRERAEVKGRNF